MIPNNIIVDGTTYTRKSESTKRAVIVLDRGWIFAGDAEDKDGRIYLEQVVHVFSWPGGGFAAMVADPNKAKADLRPCGPMNFPAGTELFRVPVPEGWGL